MSYRLKNSDFKLFLGIFDGKVRDLCVYVGDGIVVYFGIFLSGKSIPLGGEWDWLERGQEIIYWQIRRGWGVVVLDANRRGFVMWFGWIIDINITLKRHFLWMNKKDVLGLRLLPGITGKMESTPRWVKTRFCAKSEICFN